ncbi:MAG: hypothetical protein Q8L81_09200 [Bacteroidota bacterium]|nr:hypothetical protein [Bacteroidota bacterium]
MSTSPLNVQFVNKFFMVFIKFILALAMIASIVLLFFIGSGVIKPSRSWTLITQEESMN